MYCTIVFADWRRVGHVPVLVCPEGKILREPSRWLLDLAKDGKSQSLLDQYSYAMARYYDFWCHYHASFQGLDLLREFWRALRQGDPNLGWTPINKRSAKYYVNGVGLFTDWYCDRAGSVNPNPMEEKHAPWFVLLNHFNRRMKTDLLGHLFSTTKLGQCMVQTRRFDITGADDKRMRGAGKVRPKRIFKLENFHKLLLEERSPLRLMLWLLLGPGGLRISEALQLFTSDVMYDERTKEARIRLADPRNGEIITKSLGKEIKMTREAFLFQRYNLLPRELLSKRKSLWCGWKGMQVHNPEDNTAEVIWLHSFYGQMAWQAHTVYMRERALANPQHPWYLANLSRNIGHPMTYKNAGQLLKHACQRLHLPLPHNLHSLRHLYGDVTANLLKMALQDVKVGLRHSSILSTMVYTEPSTATVRANLHAASR
jgi:hypothetical protein